MAQVFCMQKEQIYIEITELIGKNEEKNVLIVSDLYLKQTNHRALLEILYRQSKNIKETQPVYSKNNFLQINYWPAYPSSIFFTIDLQFAV